LVKRKQRKNIEFYRSILENFNGDAEIYLAHINPTKYIKKSQELYEKEYNTVSKILEKI